jgi:AcrR family transcriptional regulator
VQGSRQASILDAATRRFGRNGYENTKWADIAADVGVGPTALYHYFESKQHCLFVILGQALSDFRFRFELLTGSGADPGTSPAQQAGPAAKLPPRTSQEYLAALVAVLRDSFRLTEQDIQRNRVLVAEQGLLMNQRQSPREERARQAARARTRELERAWAAFLAGAMGQGAIPDGDARLLARSILGLYNSVWHWYRPGGTVLLPQVAAFFVARSLALAGVASDVAESMLLVA